MTELPPPRANGVDAPGAVEDPEEEIDPYDEEHLPMPAFLKRWHDRAHSHPVSSLITKVLITCIGLAVFIAGLIMMVTPGPGIVGIILGLAILALEWPAAERAVARVRAWAHRVQHNARQLDPAVRRRRIALTGLATVAIVGGLVGYLYVFGWPGVTVTGWDWLQTRLTFVPELPGM